MRTKSLLLVFLLLVVIIPSQAAANGFTAFASVNDQALINSYSQPSTNTLVCGSFWTNTQVTAGNTYIMIGRTHGQVADTTGSFTFTTGTSTSDLTEPSHVRVLASGVLDNYRDQWTASTVKLLWHNNFSSSNFAAAIEVTAPTGQNFLGIRFSSGAGSGGPVTGWATSGMGWIGNTYDVCSGSIRTGVIIDESSATYTAEITIKQCDTGQLVSATQCNSDLGALSGASVLFGAPANQLIFANQTTNATGRTTFTWFIPPGQSGIVAAFTISKIGYTTKTYYLIANSNITQTYFIDRAEGFAFYNFTTKVCHDTTLGSSCSVDGGPLPITNWSVTGSSTQNGTSDPSGRFILAVPDGQFTITLSKLGYTNNIYTFTTPTSEREQIVYLYLRPISCTPNPGNFTVPAAANFTCVENVDGDIYASIFQNVNGVVVIIQNPFRLTSTSNTLSIIWPFRGYTNNVTGDNQVGSYVLGLAKSDTTLIDAVPFIIRDSVTTPTQIQANNSVVLGAIQSQMAPRIYQQQQQDSAQTSTSFIEDATAFAFRSNFLIPNLWLIWLISLLAMILVGSGIRALSRDD